MLYHPDSMKWKDAAKRAEAAGLTASLASLQIAPVVSCEQWRVVRPDSGTSRDVYLIWTAKGLLSVVCGCRTPEQNAQDRPCCHMAAAVEASFDLAIQDAYQDDDGGLVTVVEPLSGPGYTIPVQRFDA